jgi:L-ascorbate metabolism protein UlaG (beta-lactamase superfamily)
MRMLLFKAFLVILSMCGCVAASSYETSQIDGRYQNPWLKNETSPSVLKILWWQISRKTEAIHGQIIAPLARPNGHVTKGLHVTFINHATALIQMDDLNILTDPVLSDRVGPFPLLGIGVARHQTAGIRFEHIPPIDVVIISHNHYDHLDWPTLERLKANHNFLILCPEGMGQDLKAQGFERVLEMIWWDTFHLDDVTFTAVPAQHWSKRTLTDRNNSLWLGMVIKGQNAPTVYFAGDTGYGPHFAEISKRVGPIDVSLLPIGAYLPRWIMKLSHMNPEESVMAHRDLKSGWSLPIHFDTFALSDEKFGQALQDLDLAKMKHKTPNFLSWMNGSRVIFNRKKKGWVTQKFENLEQNLTKH